MPLLDGVTVRNSNSDYSTLTSHIRIHRTHHTVHSTQCHTHTHTRQNANASSRRILTAFFNFFSKTKRTDRPLRSFGSYLGKLKIVSRLLPRSPEGIFWIFSISSPCSLRLLPSDYIQNTQDW